MRDWVTLVSVQNLMSIPVDKGYIILEIDKTTQHKNSIKLNKPKQLNIPF